MRPNAERLLSILGAAAAGEPTHGDTNEEGHHEVPEQLQEQIIHCTHSHRRHVPAVGSLPRLLGCDRELDAPVLGAVFRRIVRRDRTGLAIADSSQAFVADTCADEIVEDRARAPFG